MPGPQRSIREARVLDVLVSDDMNEARPHFGHVVSADQLEGFGRKLPTRHYAAIRTTLDLGRLDMPGVLRWVGDCARVVHPFGSVEFVLLHRTPAAPGLPGLAQAVVGMLDTAIREAGPVVPEWDFSAAELRPPLPPQLADVSFVGHGVACARPAYYHDAPLGEDDFTAACQLLRRSAADGPCAASYVVPTFNEAKGLPSFLASLEAAGNGFGAQREFIFVLNGCTDGSERIIEDHRRRSALNIRTERSRHGIVSAFRHGVASRRLGGFIGKIDADVVVHPHALDLMERCMTASRRAQVVYAEPLTRDPVNPFNVLSHNPQFASHRNYYTGKTSLYRLDPLAEPVMSCEEAASFATEDVPLSFNFAYYYGLESIMRAPGACVFEKCVDNYEDFAAQVWRAECEVERVLTSVPHFSWLSHAMRQTITYEPLKELVGQALSVPRYVDYWTRLESTK